MGEVKWIKLAVDMFSNRKIRMIESMEEGDAVLIVWIKLLTLAGQINDGGRIYITPEKPYTQKLLAVCLNSYEALISEALDVFSDFGMIQREGDYITIANWDKYQNVNGMERIREQTRKRVERYREKAKAERNVTEKEGVTPCNVTETLHVTLCNAREEDKKEDIEEDKNKTLTCFNARARTREEKPVKHRYGEYKNVLLTDEELEKLKERFPQDWERRIEDLSLGIESKGYKYKSHYAALLSWARRDEARKPAPKQGSAEELDDFYKMVADWAKEDDG